MKGSKVKHKNIALKSSLTPILFQEKDLWFAHLPSLDLYGYGKSKKKARRSLEFTLDEFLDYTTKKGIPVNEI